ncbi:MAG: hypothetical protein AAGC64_07325 [Bacteroidota bacterium]
MRYREFFRIVISHQYFSDGLEDLVLVPQEQTSKALSKQHFLAKESENGINVLIPVNEEDKILPVINPDDVFAFNAFPTSEIFKEFTDVSAISNGKILFFTNEGLGAENQELVSSETAAGGTLCGFPAIAKIEIKVSEIDLSPRSPAPAYQVVFKSKSVKWRYYFVSNAGTTDLVVEDRNKHLTFNKLKISDYTSDQVAASLRANFQDAQLVIFESGTPIAYSDRAIKNIQLLINRNVAIKHLPNPEVLDQGIQIIQIK